MSIEIKASGSRVTIDQAKDGNVELEHYKTTGCTRILLTKEEAIKLSDAIRKVVDASTQADVLDEHRSRDPFDDLFEVREV
jgi:hypothetical protein